MLQLIPNGTDPVEVRRFAAVMNGSEAVRRRNHRDIRACMAPIVNGTVRLPSGQGCDGLCTEDVIAALERLRHKVPGGDLDRLGKLARPAVVDAQRERDGADGLYVRLDRLATDRAPRWWRQAVPTPTARAWAVRLLWWCRSADPIRLQAPAVPALSPPWRDLSILPLSRWADRDRTTCRVQHERASTVIGRLHEVRPTFVADNVVAPLSRKDLVSTGMRSVA